MPCSPVSQPGRAAAGGRGARGGSGRAAAAGRRRAAVPAGRGAADADLDSTSHGEIADRDGGFPASCRRRRRATTFFTSFGARS